MLNIDIQVQRPAFELNAKIAINTQGINAVFGESGCGKTTLLRCIAGLEPDCKGTIALTDPTTQHDEIWQSPQSLTPAHQRSIGFVFQQPSLLPHLTVEGNLHYASKRAPSPFQHTEEIYKLLNIHHLFDRRPDALSGGEQQRVAIARALLSNPKILLMDEPLASLDENRKAEFLPYLEKLHNTLSIPILYVSHSMTEIMHIADNMILMEEGNIVEQGPINTIMTDLQHSITALRDPVTVLDGTVKEKDELWKLAKIQMGTASLWLHDQQYTVGDHTRLTIFARNVSITLEKPTQTSILNSLQADIIDLKNLVSEGFALVKLCLGEHFLLAKISQKSWYELKLDIGMRVWIQVKSAALLK